MSINSFAVAKALLRQAIIALRGDDAEAAA